MYARMYIIVSLIAALSPAMLLLLLPLLPPPLLLLLLTAAATATPGSCLHLAVCPRHMPCAPSPHIAQVSAILSYFSFASDYTSPLPFTPTPRTPCLDALAQAFRFPSSYYCRRLRASPRPSHIVRTTLYSSCHPPIVVSAICMPHLSQTSRLIRRAHYWLKISTTDRQPSS